MSARVDPPPASRGVLVALLASALLLGAGGCAGDIDNDAPLVVDVANYPNRPITLVSWVSPGSAGDLFARAVARVGERHFGQRINVITRLGGGGAAAMGYVYTQPADGYTLLVLTSSGAVTLAAGIVPFQVEDFTYIERLQLDPYLVAVRADSPFRDLRELFAFAKANPGSISMAGTGVMAGAYLGFARLMNAAGSPDIRWIPYEGTSDGVVAVLGGHVDGTTNNFSVVREHVRAGSMRVLGIARPLDVLPGVATFAEQGYDVDPMQWRAIMAPGGMPKELAARIQELLQKTAEDPEFGAYLAHTATELGLTGDAELFHRMLAEEVEWGRGALDDLGIRRFQRRQ